MDEEERAKIVRIIEAIRGLEFQYGLEAEQPGGGGRGEQNGQEKADKGFRSRRC